MYTHTHIDIYIYIYCTEEWAIATSQVSSPKKTCHANQVGWAVLPFERSNSSFAPFFSLIHPSFPLRPTLSLSSPSVCVSVIDGSSELLSSPKPRACRHSADNSPVCTADAAAAAAAAVLFLLGDLTWTPCTICTQKTEKCTSADTQPHAKVHRRNRQVWLKGLCVSSGWERSQIVCGFFLMFLNVMHFFLLTGGKKNEDDVRPCLLARWSCLMCFNW